MITFREFITEKAKIKPFGPDVFNSKKQMTAIAKNSDFLQYVFGPGDKAYARKDHDPFWDNTFWVSNQDAKYVIKYNMSKGGKIFGYTVYKKTGNVLNIIKTVGEQ